MKKEVESKAARGKIKLTLIWAEQNISADMKVFLTLKKGRESTINVLHN